jgi:hypothetical protein
MHLQLRQAILARHRLIADGFVRNPLGVSNREILFQVKFFLATIA